MILVLTNPGQSTEAPTAELCACRGEALRKGEADTASRTGDYSRFAFKILHTFPLGDC
jgi:hypothetical protein